ncbi:MAG: hypothetical protein WC980_10755 [Candidatus Brocadiia bacterium]
MKKYKYEIRQSHFHGGDNPRLIGRTNDIMRARRLASCGDCKCGGGKIYENGALVRIWHNGFSWVSYPA